MKTFYKIDDVPLPSNEAHHDKIKGWIKNAYGWMDSYRCQPVQVIWNIQIPGYPEQYKYSSYLCHYHYVNGVNAATTWTYNAFTTQTSADHIAFTEWLLSSDSPYRDLFTDDRIFILRDEKTNRPVLIGCLDIQNIPARLWANFLIATRLSSGWALSHVWQYLINNGFTAKEALVLIPFFYFNNETVTVDSTRDSRHLDSFRKANSLHTCTPNYGDQPFNYASGRYASFRKINSFSPDKDAFISFKDGGTFNPCNYIWDDTTSVARNIYDDKGALRTIAAAFAKDKPLDGALVASMKDSLEKGKTID